MIVLDGVHKVTAKSGKVYWYYRGPPRVKLPGDPSKPEFRTAYLQASGAVRRRAVATARGSIAATVQTFLGSRAMKDLSIAYQSVIRRHLTAISDAAGEALIAHLQPRHIRADIDRLEPNAARQRFKAWRKLCTYACDHQLIEDDPSDIVKRPKAPKTDGHTPWTDEDVAAFRAFYPLGTMRRAAMELLFWTGARISDAVRLGPGMIDKGGVLTFRQVKTGGPAFVPWTCPLPVWASDMEADRDMMHAALAALPERHMTFLVTEFGKARSVKSLGNWFADSARAAGVMKTAHGLRKYRSELLSEVGASAHQMGAWLGHESLQETEHYAKGANRRKMIIGAEQEQNSVKSKTVL